MTKGEIDILPEEISEIINDPEESAKAANLIYVSDTEEGIKRKNGAEALDIHIREKKLPQKNNQIE